MCINDYVLNVTKYPVLMCVFYWILYTIWDFEFVYIADVQCANVLNM